MNRIVSKFGRFSTAAEVAAGHDLSGKRAIVTGASAGIGVETARVLASIGAEVVLAVRDESAGQKVADRIVAEGGKAYVSKLDLSDLESVRAFARREGDRPLHLLINNAGVMACPFGRTKQGFETQLGVNHIAHFLLTELLMPALKKGAPARVVAVSSSGHWWSPFDFEDPNFDRVPYDKWQAYGRSKTANVLFAVEFDRRFADQGIRAFSLMPGAIETSLGRHMSEEDLAYLGITEETRPKMLDKSIPQGASTTLWAALGWELDGRGGLYLEDCAEAPLADPAVVHVGVQPYAIDPSLAARLWTWTEEAIARVSK